MKNMLNPVLDTLALNKLGKKNNMDVEVIEILPPTMHN